MNGENDKDDKDDGDDGVDDEVVHNGNDGDVIFIDVDGDVDGDVDDGNEDNITLPSSSCPMSFLAISPNATQRFNPVIEIEY